MAAIAVVAMIAALSVSAFVFAKSLTAQRAVRNGAVIDFVRSFVTQYTSPDPFNANDYADKVLALGTGNFAKMYAEKMTEVVIQVARRARLRKRCRRSASSGGIPTTAST